MNESQGLQELVSIVSQLGLSGFLKNFFSIALFMILIKKYLFNGFGKFLRDVVTEWLKNERDRIMTQTKLSECLIDLQGGIKTIVSSQQEDRIYYHDVLSILKSSITENAKMTHENQHLIARNQEMLQNLCLLPKEVKTHE